MAASTRDAGSAPPAKPLPTPTELSAPYWEGLRERRVRIQYSPSSDTWVFYPRRLAPGSLADDLEWRTISGRGEVFTFTIARRPTVPAWREELPQLLAVVRWDEGPHVVTELVNVTADRVHVGMRVRPVFAERDGQVLLHYEPEDGS